MRTYLSKMILYVICAMQQFFYYIFCNHSYYFRKIYTLSIEYHDVWNMITISEIKNILILNFFVCKISGRGNQAFGRKMTTKILWHLYYGHIRFEYFHMIKHWKSLPSHWTHNLMPNHSNVFYGHRKNSFAS